MLMRYGTHIPKNISLKLNIVDSRWTVVNFDNRASVNEMLNLGEHWNKDGLMHGFLFSISMIRLSMV